MLNDQGSPYVGRFACDWHRLPGTIPGQPQTQTRARSSIARGYLARYRPSGRQQPDLPRALLAEDLRARGGGGARREDVVDQEDPRRGRPPGRPERAQHRGPPVDTAPTSLRALRVVPPEERLDRHAEVHADHERESPRLVVPPF